MDKPDIVKIIQTHVPSISEDSIKELIKEKILEKEKKIISGILDQDLPTLRMYLKQFDIVKSVPNSKIKQDKSLIR